MGRHRPRHGHRGGEDIPALRQAGPRVATGLGSVVSLLAVAVLPMTRGDDDFRAVGIRVTAVAFLVLVGGLVLARPALVPLAAVLVGGLYGAELAIADAPLDVASPAMAVGLLLAVELAYWSIEERGRWTGDPGDSLRRSALVAAIAVGASLVAATLLALVDAVRAQGLALDLLGATAAAAVLVTVLLAARSQSSRGS